MSMVSSLKEFLMNSLLKRLVSILLEVLSWVFSYILYVHKLFFLTCKKFSHDWNLRRIYNLLYFCDREFFPSSKRNSFFRICEYGTQSFWNCFNGRRWILLSGVDYSSSALTDLYNLITAPRCKISIMCNKKHSKLI